MGQDQPATIDPTRKAGASARRAWCFAALCGGLSVTACARAPAPTGRFSESDRAASANHSRPAAPVGRYKLGPPYRVGGIWYVPAEQPRYRATGRASWYGARYGGRATADGERFDQAALTGAHPTLPLPCLVEVVNLENGRSLRVRVNDRGAFRPGRVIDLSRAAAERLGFVAQGTARVSVRYLGPAPLDPDARTAARVLDLSRARIASGC